MTDKIEPLANDEIAVIVWPYGAGQKQVGLCFDDEENPAAIFALAEQRAFQLRSAIFGEQLRTELAALRQQLDEARDQLAVTRIELTGAQGAHDLAEADRDRLLVVYRAAEALATADFVERHHEWLALRSVLAAYRSDAPAEPAPADDQLWEWRLRSLKQAITDEAPVWEHTFLEGNAGLVVGVPDAAVVALRWFDGAAPAEPAPADELDAARRAADEANLRRRIAATDGDQ